MRLLHLLQSSLLPSTIRNFTVAFSDLVKPVLLKYVDCSSLEMASILTAWVERFWFSDSDCKDSRILLSCDRKENKPSKLFERVVQCQ